MSQTLIHSELTSKIIRAFYNVYNKLGYGFLEKVYERSMMIELNKLGINCVAQRPIEVNYFGSSVGLYYADIITEEKVIIEIKAAENLAPEHEAQLLNYLKATDIEVGLLLNFGNKPQYRRKIFTNELKTQRSLD